MRPCTGTVTLSPQPATAACNSTFTTFATYDSPNSGTAATFVWRIDYAVVRTTVAEGPGDASDSLAVDATVYKKGNHTVSVSVSEGSPANTPATGGFSFVTGNWCALARSLICQGVLRELGLAPPAAGPVMHSGCGRWLQFLLPLPPPGATTGGSTHMHELTGLLHRPPLSFRPAATQ